MNRDQIASLVRWFFATFGGFITGFFVAKGWFTADQVMAVLNSESFIGLVVSVISGVVGVFAHTAIAKLNAVAAMPQVEKVVVTSVALARDTPSPKVTNG